MLKIFKKEYVSYVFVLLAGLLMSGIAAYATTSIGLGIATGGSFYATGTVNVAGAILASSTIATSGNITVPAAYALDTAGGGALNIGTTTATSITIGSVTANTTFGGNIKTPAYWGIDAGASGDLNIGTTTATNINIGRSGQTVFFSGTASTTALIVGGTSGGSTINNILFGYCTISTGTMISASTSAFVVCTQQNSLVTVTSSYRVFVEATSSLQSNIIVQAASSTPTAGSISLQLFNLGNAGALNPATTSLNFWAVK